MSISESSSLVPILSLGLLLPAMCIGIFELGACVDSLGRLKLPSEPLSEGAVSSLLSLSEPPPSHFG